MWILVLTKDNQEVVDYVECLKKPRKLVFTISNVMSKKGPVGKIHLLTWAGTIVTVIMMGEDSLCMILETCTSESNQCILLA